MKTDNLNIYKVFHSGGDVHYVLPHFQREYTWVKENWDTLLNDSLAIYNENQPGKTPEHFLGSLVVIEEGVIQGTMSAFKLVDGQQRLTTISLLLLALSQLTEQTNPNLSKKIKKMLLNDNDDQTAMFKLLPTTKYGDRNAYTDIVLQGQSDNQTSNITKAYNYLKDALDKWISAGEVTPERFYETVVICFQVVFINLNHQESPYKIFESLNAKGKPLTQADLVRNYIAMRLPGTQQEVIFNKYWSPIENMLQEQRTVGNSRLGELTAFLRHYLAMRTGVLCNVEHVYARFRDRMEREFKSDDLFDTELATLKRFAGYYNKLLRPHGDVNEKLLTRLNILEITTAYPFLLRAYEAHHDGQLSASDLTGLLGILENYIVRRVIDNEPTNYMTKMFPTLWDGLDKAQLLSSLKQTLATKNYPTDRNIEQALIKNNFYHTSWLGRTVLILESIEQALWAGSGAIGQLSGKATLEHILPQSIANMVEWQTELGDNWQQVHKEYLHTLGNLTLVTGEWNSELSNRPYNGPAKNGKPGKKELLSSHGLRLNREYFKTVDNWNEEAINDRAQFLTTKLLTIWPSFGVAPVPTTGSKLPDVLTIEGQQFTINPQTWRQVILSTADYLIKQGKFDQIRASAPNYFLEDDPTRNWDSHWKLLSNGWRVYVDWSASSAISLCKKFVAAAGISVLKWDIQTK